MYKSMGVKACPAHIQVYYYVGILIHIFLSCILYEILCTSEVQHV